MQNTQAFFRFFTQNPWPSGGLPTLKLIEGKKEKETEQKSEVQTEGEKSSKIKRKNDDNFSEREKDDELEKEDGE